MISSEFCSTNNNMKERRIRLQQKRLEFLILFRDSLERRLSATNASIKTLEEQISRNQSVEQIVD